jgi:sulfonate transport system permease protein
MRSVMRQFEFSPRQSKRSAAIKIARNGAGWFLFICAWQLVSPLTHNWALPGPLEILSQVAADWQTLLPHLLATLSSAAIGLAAGLAVGLALGIAFSKSRVIELVGYGPALVIYALPIIALAPLLALLLPNGMVPSVFAAITIFFPMTLTTRRALADIDANKRRLFDFYGADAGSRFRHLELPSAIPGIVAGVQVLVPWALLGAMLGEFVGGRWGLGVLMLGTLGRGEPVRLWAVAAVATGLSGVGFILVGFVRASLEARLGAGSEISDAGSTTDPIGLLHLLFGLVSVALAWELFAQFSSIGPPLVLGPIEVIVHLAADRTSLNALMIAFGSTAPMALLALGIGVGVSTIWAIVGRMWPIIGSILTSATLVTQSVPLLALAPLLVLSLGRGALVTIVISVLAIVFPGYAAILQRLETVPRELESLSDFYTKRRMRTLRYVEMPWAAYGIFTAMRIAAPRALLGVMLAEYLATGQGLGFLMATARGRIDFTTIWAGIALTALFSLTLYFLAGLAERQVSKLVG